MLGTVLGERYRIITVLGVGGFGKTYLAEDVQHPEQSKCVVKQFKPVNQDPRSLQIARRLFDKEVEMLARLGQHDQIPTFINFFEENQEFYLVQELIEGEALSEEFSHHKLTEAEAIHVLRDVLGVLEFVHRNQVIHRDIKPANLIRRKQDGRIVLIDFGAVKEINTQLAGSGQTSFTVGIGTQGYTPTEQLAGKPRFCSDLYAVGMTVIQGLTGFPPSQLPEDPDTSEYLWQDYTQVSLGLRIILSRLVRFHHSQRYQSATEVLQALDRLAELPTDMTELPISLLIPQGANDITQANYTDISTHWTQRLRAGVKVVAIATATVASFVIGLRYLGWTDSLELAAYDQMTQLRPQLPPDPRLLVVEINESDLRELDRTTPSDVDLANVIRTLSKFSPRVIGVDLYRDLPQGDGRADLLKLLQAPNVVSIFNLGSSNSDKILPPPGVSPKQVGFNDFPIDPDNTVRRGLLFAYQDNILYYSFSLNLALKYLAVENITPKSNPQDRNIMQLGDVAFPPLSPTAGAYHRIDTRGYQIMADFRNSQDAAPTVSFVDVLNGKIDPALVKDRVVVIGTTASSAKDLFVTPYTNGQQDDEKMAGVMVHAQFVSQFLSAVLDGRSLFHFWPDWVEMAWIMGWAAVGGGVAWVMRHPVKLGASAIVMMVVLSGSCFALFLHHIWVPVLSPAIAATLAGGGVIVYRTYLLQKQQQLLLNTWISGPMSNITRRVD